MNSGRVRAVSRTAPEFPASLRELDLVPDPIFTIGDVNALQRPLVSIVGTRDPTAYGLRTTRAIATAFARAGVVVVSGMARGIDAAAHRASLETDSPTIAVLGTGIDVPYPVGHTELHRVIGTRGLVMSENPPRAKAHKGSFPRRNRIIAALGKITIVVEAGHKSGALNTARQAMDLGKTVAAVPGPIDSPQSDGTNQLLRDGAAVIATVADALALAGISQVTQSEPIHLSDIDAKVWSTLGGQSLSIDTIAARTDLSTRECLAAVTSLELSGMIESLITGEIRRR